MTALNQLIVGLLMVVVTANIGNVQGKCTPIKLYVKAEYLMSSLKEDYKHIREIAQSTSFKRNYDSMDVAAAVSGSYGGFSASASASFSEVSETETSNSKLTDKTRTTKVTYNEGQNHVVLKITKTVTINGRSKTVVSREIRYPIRVKDSPSFETIARELEKKSEDYIKYNYGGITGGKIRRNTYEATACIAECEDDEVKWGWWGKEYGNDSFFTYFPTCYSWLSYGDFKRRLEKKTDYCEKVFKRKNMCRKSCGHC